MSDDVANPHLDKKVAFVENTHQHAKLILKLRHDGVTQSKFFRAIIAGYLDGDERIQSYIDDMKPQNKKKKASSITAITIIEPSIKRERVKARVRWEVRTKGREGERIEE